MSANNDYKLKNNVYSGDNVRAVARASRVDGLQNISLSQVAGDQYARTTGLLRAVGPGWVVNRQGRKILKGGRARRTFPWQISIDGNGFIHVKPGTINGLLPVNIFATLGPTGQGTIGYVALQCFTDGVTPTDAQLYFSTSVPPPPAHAINVTPFEFQVLIGCTVDLAPLNVVDGLLWANPKIAIQTLKPQPIPGAPYYDNNYTWEITQY